jgi:hypothetical protein
LMFLGHDERNGFTLPESSTGEYTDGLGDVRFVCIGVNNMGAWMRIRQDRNRRGVHY